MVKDDRVIYVKLFGKEYPLCLTVSAQERINQEFGSMVGMFDRLKKADATIGSTYVAFCHHMMQGGNDRVRALAWMEGEEVEVPEVPTREMLSCLLTSADLADLKEKLFQSVAVSNSRTVEVGADKEKNVETTQE